MISRDFAHNILNIYKKAWEEQDSDLILEIFTPDATYHERAFEKPFVGHKEIKEYWDDKVVSKQKNINFNLLSLYVDGNTIIAEWDSEFDDTVQNLRKLIREVAILEFIDGKIAHLREYWTSKQI